jgi:hypothetical protein
MSTGQFPQASGPTPAKPSGDHTPLGGFVFQGRNSSDPVAARYAQYFWSFAVSFSRRILECLIIASALAAFSTAAYPTDRASYATLIQRECARNLQEGMKSLSFSAVDNICRCVADTVLKELSIADMEGTSGTSGKIRSTVGDAYKTCYLKAGAP